MADKNGKGRGFILIVEDDPGTNKPEALQLRQLGMEIRSAYSAKETVEILKGGLPELMLLDYSLPDMSALELLAELKRNNIQAPPYIFVTGRENVKAAVEAMQAGAQDYIIKDDALREVLPDRVKKALANTELRRELEQARRLAEEERGKYKLFFENGSDAVFIHEARPDGPPANFIEVNDIACALLGYTKEELLNLSPAGITARDMTERRRKAMEAQPCDDRAACEVVYLTKDKRRVAVEVLSRIFNYKGSEFVLSLARDITERKRIEETLRKSEEQARLVLNSAGEAIYGIDIQGNCTFVNTACLRMLGYAGQEALLGRNMHALIHHSCPDGRAMPVEVCRIFQAFRKNKGVHVDDEVLWRADGSSFPVEYWSYPKNESGLVSGAVVTFVDITERKQVERYREISREVLQILNEPAAWQPTILRVIAALKKGVGVEVVGIRLQDGEDFPYFAQEGLPGDFLRTENTLLERDAQGKVCRDEDGKVKLECTCGLVISGRTDPSSPLFTKGGSFWTNDSLRLLDLPPDQDPRYKPRNQCMHHGYASMALVPIRDENRIIGLLHFNDRRKGRFSLAIVELLEGIAANIGAALMRKRAEQALKETAETKSRFASMVSHELRSPLTAVSLGVRLILDEPGGMSDEHKKLLALVLDNTNRLGRLINNVLDFQKMAAGKMTFNLLENDINGLVRTTAWSMGILAKNKGLDLAVEINDAIPAVKFDKDRLTQVITNLLANAIAHTEKGIITVSAGYESDRLHIAVRDTGRGIKAEDLPRLFQAFEQLGGGGENRLSGTGLGLAIAKEIILAHHGKIWAESEPGKGSVFHFTLPVEQRGN